MSVLTAVVPSTSGKASIASPRLSLLTVEERWNFPASRLAAPLASPILARSSFRSKRSGYQLIAVYLNAVLSTLVNLLLTC
jgi:hypothetical protein